MMSIQNGHKIAGYHQKERKKDSSDGIFKEKDAGSGIKMSAVVIGRPLRVINCRSQQTGGGRVWYREVAGFVEKQKWYVLKYHCHYLNFVFSRRFLLRMVQGSRVFP
ncbi:MAG: hypothetical protein HQK89_09980 [Nitrospirae bacterium]|nr:hypothetical protein [Nitrospirota bacterium]